MTPKISTVVSAYNEEEKIEECLKSVENLADEIIFVDNTSHDKTIEIAKRHKAKVFIRPNDPVMLNKNKNYGFSKAAGDWILSLDADERITPVLAKEIKAAVKQKNIKGFEIPRKNIIFNKWIQHSIWWPDYNLRLFQKNSQFLRKLDTIYTESETENFIKKGDQIHWYDAIRWPASDFLKTFFLE